MENGTKAMLHILENTHNSDIRRLGVGYFYSYKDKIIMPCNFYEA